MVQLAYSQEPERAFAGLLAGGPTDIVTRSLELAAGIPFGIALEPGTVRAVEVAPTTLTGFVFVGVAVHQHPRENLAQLTDLGISDNEDVSVLRKGRIWVPSESTIVPYTSAVFARHTVNAGADQLGSFRLDADTARADDLSAVAEWQDYIAVAGLLHSYLGFGLLSINLPGA